jgi:uncharacterized protein
MSENPKEGLDRRDFMIASIATVGASAVLARNVGPANAQETGHPLATRHRVHRRGRSIPAM